MKLQMRTHNNPGILITFCGLDGSGKTTQIKMIHDYLINMSLPVFLTKQPTDFVRNSEIFRTYMDMPNHDAYDYRALSLLCASDRVQHTNRVILPELEQGNFVLSDRYFYCGIANLKARGYSRDTWVYDVGQFIINPDISFFLDVPADVAIARVRGRPQEKDRFIDEDFQYRLRDEYLKIAGECDGIVLDSHEDPAETFLYIKAEVDKILMKRTRFEGRIS